MPDGIYCPHCEAVIARLSGEAKTVARESRRENRHLFSCPEYKSADSEAESPKDARLQRARDHLKTKCLKPRQGMDGDKYRTEAEVAIIAADFAATEVARLEQLLAEHEDSAERALADMRAVNKSAVARAWEEAAQMCYAERDSGWPSDSPHYRMADLLGKRADCEAAALREAGRKDK